jgi:hypothetical protein
MLSIIGIKKTIKQHTADMDITDSVLQYLNLVCYITHIGLIPLYTISKRNYFLPIIIIYLNKYNLPGIAFIPQSMTTAPGLTQLPLTNSGFPTATTRISALKHYKYVNVLQLKYFTRR